MRQRARQTAEGLSWGKAFDELERSLIKFIGTRARVMRMARRRQPLRTSLDQHATKRRRPRIAARMGPALRAPPQCESRKNSMPRACAGKRRRQMRSNTAAMPCPPPMHMVTRA